MTHFKITERGGGLNYGIFEAPTPEAALDALYQDIGYASAADCARVLETTREALVEPLLVEAVEALS